MTRIKRRPNCTDCKKAIGFTSNRRFRVPPTTALTPGFSMTRATKDRPGDVKLMGAAIVCRTCFKGEAK